MATNGAATGEMAINGAATGEMATNGAVTREMATNGAATGEMATNGATTGEMATNGAATGEMATNGVVNGEMATNGAATGEMATNGAATGEMATNGVANGEMVTDGMTVAAAPPPPAAAAAAAHKAAATLHEATCTIGRTLSNKTQEFFATLKQNLDSESHCDFTIRTDEGDVHCHKVVLLASSSYLQKVINKNTNSYYEPDIRKATLDKLLAWIYYSDVTIDESCFVELITIAIKWNLIDLYHTSVEFISENLNLDNVCLFYSLSRQHRTNRLGDICSYFIREQYEILHNRKQLEKLTLQHFCEIISYDKINIANEDVIYNSILRVLETRSNNELLTLCYTDTLRFKQITPQYLVDMIMMETRYKIMLQYNKTVDVKKRVGVVPRHWDELLYINSNYDLCKYDVITGKWIKFRELAKSKVDIYTAVATSYHRMVMVGGETSTDITLTEEAQPFGEIPKLPTPMPGCGVIMAGDTIIIVGGQRNINPESYHKSAFWLEVRHRELKALKPMNYSMASPLMAISKGILYVIGGVNGADDFSSRRVQALNLMHVSNDWKDCGLLPQGCDGTNSGVLVFAEKVMVLTTEYCMTYDAGADKWSVTQYERQGDQLKPMFYRDGICALVKKNGKYCVKFYNDIYNEWKLMIKDVPNVLFTGSAVIERRYIYNRVTL